MKYTMNQLKGMDRCQFRRQHKLSSIKEVNTNIARREAIRKCIYGYMRKELTWQQVEQIINDEAYPEEDMLAGKTREIVCDDLANKYIKRYISSDNRVPQLAPESTMDIFGIEVTVDPDVFFYDGKTLEIVKFFLKKPDITISGRKLDASVAGCLPLYAMLYYGKQLLAYIDPNRKFPVEVKASFYFLKKSNDNFDKGVFDLDFFDGAGKNVVSLSDAEQFPTTLDQHYYTLYKDFEAGSQIICNPDVCRNCNFRAVCRFENAPKAIEEVKAKTPANVMNLTENQKKAIGFEYGVARINAVAGAGKTMVLGMRVTELLKKGYKPEEICVLSFTNAAAEEMTTRIKDYVETLIPNSGIDLDKLISTTFNGLGNDIISKCYNYLGFTSVPMLIEEGERMRIIEELVSSMEVPGLNYRNLKANEAYLKGGLVITKKIFDIFKSNRIVSITDETLEFVLKKLDVDKKNITRETLEKLMSLYQEYSKRLIEENYLEYADQEWMVIDLYRMIPEYFRSTGIKHVIVDEFQDSNLRQLSIIKCLCQSSVITSLMVVGDDAQAIYGFRDTSPKNIIHFFDLMCCQEQDFNLLANFRSVPGVINFANKILRNNKEKMEKNLVATRPDNGMVPVVQGYFDSKKEYADIAKAIEQDIAFGKDPKDIAFIAMSKYELLKMQDLLKEKKIPCILLVPETTSENSRVQACVSLMNYLTHPEEKADVDIVTYLNALCHGKFFELPEAQQNEYLKQYHEYVEKFAEFTVENKKEAFRQMAELLRNEPDEVYDHFLEVVDHNKTWGKICHYFYNFKVYGSEDSFSKKLPYPGVALTTAHSSKGLEWDIVYNSITKYDNKLIRYDSRIDELEERRRLLFVSATRAREKLIITGLYYSFGTVKDKNFNIFLKECYENVGKDIEEEFDKLTK